jgi:Arc/MetJ-type ribon-helix-helix transcriptional regulator
MIAPPDAIEAIRNALVELEFQDNLDDEIHQARRKALLKRLDEVAGRSVDRRTALKIRQ